MKHTKMILFILSFLATNVFVQHSILGANDSCKQPALANDTQAYALVHTKGLEHDVQTGLLSHQGQKKYDLLVQAARVGDQKTLQSMVQVPRSQRKFVYLETLGTYADFPLTKIPPFPQISSKEAAIQLTEVYLQALARDVAFHEYGTGIGSDKDTDGSSITLKALKIINEYGNAYKGPLNAAGKSDPSVLFRGNYDGAQIGPYISQFLLVPLSIPAASLPHDLGFSHIPPSVFQTNQMQPIPGNRNFGITNKDYIALQNGLIPQPYSKEDFSLEKRYISTGRDLASFVHFDSPYPLIYNALQILYGYTFHPSSRHQNIKKPGFEKLGYLDILELLNAVAQETEKAVSAYKWQGQCVLRPEEFAHLVHLTKTTGKNTYHISPDLLSNHGGIDLLSWILHLNKKEGADTYLLPQAYPEGAPLHPSYPSGHATFSGAYITVLKAIFNDSAPFSSIYKPVKPDPQDPRKLTPLSREGEDRMTIGSELNKLASNCAMGRNFAGIHYRADADYGMRLGESVALSFLQNYARTLKDVKGLELTKIDGTHIKILKDCSMNV